LGAKHLAPPRTASLISLFLVLSVGVVAIGYDQYRRQERQIRTTQGDGPEPAGPGGAIRFSLAPQSRPAASRTAETLPVRRDGGQVIFLNDLRRRQNTALNLRLPLAPENRLPAAVAALVALAGAAAALLWRHQRAELDRLRYRTELERRALVDHLGYLTLHAHDIILLADEEFRIVEANERAVSAYGYSREELLGLNLRDLRAPSALPEIDAHWAAAAAGSVYRTRHRRKDGSTFPVESSSRTIRVDGREFRQAIVRDITERERHEAEREAMLALLRLLNAPSDTAQLLNTLTGFLQQWADCDAVGIRLRDGEDYPYFETRGFPPEFVREENRLCALDADQKIVRDTQGNPVLECMCGNVICGRFDPRLPFFTENGSFWTNCTSELLASASQADLLTRTRNRCHGEGYESVALIPIGSGGENLGLLQLNDRRKNRVTPDLISFLERAATSIATGLTRRQAQAALRESEQKFRAIADYTADWENWFAPDGTLLWVSPAVESIAGYTVAECHSLPDYPFCLVHEADREASRAVFQEAQRGGSRRNFEFRLVRKDGSVRHCAVSWRPIYDSAGRHLGRRSSVRDITEQRQLEEQLRQSQKLESVGRLAGGVAHDFNNLLTVINGYSDLLLSRLKEDDPLWSTVNEIRRAGQRAAELTQQLLAFSRRQVIEPRPLNLNRLIGETLDMLQRLVGEDIELVTTLEPALGAVMADRSSLHQVLMNLAVNARDAMSGGGRLTIETANVDLEPGYALTHPETPPGPYVLVAASDTGAGMDEQTRQHIFEPFFTTKEGEKGTGLGLSTIYGIVRQLGGWIWVYSEPGRGTTFKIYLPRLEAAAEAEEAEAAAPATLHGSETVLVVEDHADVRRLAVTALTEYGYQALEAAGPQEALELAASHTAPIDLLVTDVVMPRMTGKELATRLSESRPELKVLYMSGYTENVIGHQGVLDAGVNFLAKPFVPEDLARKVRQVFDAAPRTGAILVVDDEEAIRNLFREVLEGAGHHVSVARDGREALALARERRFDVVVTDLVMPEREGIETILTLRKDRPGLKIIAVSGAFGGAMLKAARVLGADVTLRKPVKPCDLVETVRALLQ
jgi:PAS domain S-box-containing protein